MDDIAINTLAINDLVRKLRENIIKNDSNDQESLRTVDECAKSSNVSLYSLIYLLFFDFCLI